MKKQLTEIEKKEYEYLLKVLSAGINGFSAPEPYNGIDWENILSYSKHCSVNSIFANVVLKLPKEKLAQNEVVSRLFKIKNMELLIDGNLHYEVEKVIAEFDKLKIRNLPLKGYFMKNEYPQSDFRSVCDFDILFDKNDLEKLYQAFENLGYEFVSNDGSQYHFQKKPYMYIEMHSTLTYENDEYSILGNAFDRAKKRNEYEYSYEMTPEDYYIFMLVHASHHYRTGGMGIRMVLDEYVYYKNHCKTFDFDYLNKQLKAVNLTIFEKKLRQLAFDWFETPHPKLTFNNFETYILLSAVIGRLDVSIAVYSATEILKSKKEGKKSSKFAFLITSIFPSRKSLSYKYPYLEKFPVLLPVAWVSRWWHRFFVQKNVNIKRGITNRMSYTNDDISYLQNLMEEVGFSDLQ